MSSSTEHVAAIISQVGSPLTIANRPTPKPGPNDLLIQTSYIALNPIDYYQRDTGFVVAFTPAVSGSDLAGTVLAAGSSVPADAPKPGSRVLAFAPAYHTQANPDYGALQAKVLVPSENVTPLPASLGEKEASVFGMAVATTWSGLYRIGVPRDTKLKPEDKKGFLLWGASSSVGSMVVQVAKLLGFRVYATASGKYHEYTNELGAARVFDYKDSQVVTNIVKAAKEDGVTIEYGYDAVGAAAPSVEILNELKGNARSAKLASAIPLFRNPSPETEGVEVKFVLAPDDEEERREHFHFIFAEWLNEKLQKGELVPSPQNIKLTGTLQTSNEALDELKQGVSGTKLVLKV